MVFDAVCRSTTRLEGKTVIITGANTGIGKCTAQDLFKRGARVILACRNIPKAQQAAADIIEACEGQQHLGKLAVAELDLANLSSIRKCAEKLLETEAHIDILINNAGVLCPKSTTTDGFEMQFGTNHLGHFLFTLLLLPRIIQSAPARIINVSSHAHYFNLFSMNFKDLNWENRWYYSASEAYCQSKLANVFFTKELTRKLTEANIKGVTTYCLHPGGVASEFQRHADDLYFKGASIFTKMFNMFLKSPELGAQTIIYCAVEEKLATESGLYYAECRKTPVKCRANNDADAKRLWDISSKMVGLGENHNAFTSK